MNILLEVKHTKTVTYFGITLQVPPDVKFLAADQNGRLYGYAQRPYPDYDGTQWMPSVASGVLIGEVDLEGHKWDATLQGV